MTITEFREEIDRQIGYADKRCKYSRQNDHHAIAARWQWRCDALRDIKALASHLEE